MTTLIIVLSIALAAMMAALIYQMDNLARTSPCTFLFGALFSILFIVAPLLLHLTSGYALSVKGMLITDESIYLIYGSIVIVFVSAYLLFAMMQLRDSGQGATNDSTGTADAARRETNNLARTLFYISGLVVLVGVVSFIRSTNMSLGELFLASRFEWLQEGKADIAALGFSHYLIGLSAFFAYADIAYRNPNRIFSIMVYLGLAFMVFLTGERKWVLFVGSGWLAGYFDVRGRVFYPSAKALIIAVTLVFLAFAWQFGRTVDWDNLNAQSFNEVSRDFRDTVPKLLQEGDATYFYRASLDAIRLNDQKDLMYPLALVRRLVFLPFPDEWTFGMKPEGIPFLFADELEAGSSIRRGNTPPGLIGLFVLSFGPLATHIMLPVLLLLPLKVLDRFVRTGQGVMRIGFWSIYTVTIILLMRGSTGGIYFLISSMAVLGVIYVGYGLMSLFLARAKRAIIASQFS